VRLGGCKNSADSMFQLGRSFLQAEKRKEKREKRKSAYSKTLIAGTTKKTKKTDAFAKKEPANIPVIERLGAMQSAIKGGSAGGESSED